MSGKLSRSTASAPATPASPHVSSKLPKFLQKQGRERTKSIIGPVDPGSNGSNSSKSSSGSPPGDSPSSPKLTGSDKVKRKFGGGKEEKPLPIPVVDNAAADEPPEIVEPPAPVNIPRPRTRSERPIPSMSDLHPSVNLFSTSPSSSTKMGDLPTRLSGWFSHTFSTSSTDLSLPNILSQSHLASSSPKGKSTALIMAAKHGKGHLDKAMRYIMDSDTTPDKCTDPIWLLGVQHPGYEPPPPNPVVQQHSRRSSTDSSRRSASSFRSSASSYKAPPQDLSQSTPASPSISNNPSSNWPPVFYADFTSRIWLTYRSQFAPIRDSTLQALEAEGEVMQMIPTSPPTKRWNWGGEKSWSSDSGWGCMLRTGQSLLANALLHLHLGRDWQRPPQVVHTADYVKYVQILSWFIDTPSPRAPFSVHRMALAGKDLGTDIGQWFGPSIAAGAVKTLVHSYPDAGLGVSVASDGVIYQSDVFAASNGLIGSPRRHVRTQWGTRAVLVLVGIRLGIDGVNPIYYETIKSLYTFPQSVGIAGGRPSSSYYFVGSQADNLFYLDPHHTRPAVPLRPPPSPSSSEHRSRWERETTPESDKDSPPPSQGKGRRGSAGNISAGHKKAPTSPSSVRTGSSTFSYHSPISPSPLQHQYSNSSSTASSGSYTSASASSSHVHAPPSPTLSQGKHSRWPSSASSPGSHPHLSAGDNTLDPVQEHYVTAYSDMELKTFHCERVRKMPLSGLDPSMLIGFLCKDEADWVDFRRRISEWTTTKKRPIFSIQDVPPIWPQGSDDDMGLESISDPDDMTLDDMEMEDENENENENENDDDQDNDQFFDTQSPSTSPDTSVKEGGKGSEVDTEEDPMGPETPGPNSRMAFIDDIKQKGKGRGVEDVRTFDDEDEESDIEDDWVDPSLPTPTSSPSTPPPAPPLDPAPKMAKAKSNGSTSSKKSGHKKGSLKKSQVPVPVPRVPTPPQHFPFPVSQRSQDDSASSDIEGYEADSQRGSMDGSGVRKTQRMHTARARDGGRTQSGGVRGILTDDDGFSTF